MSFVIPIKDRKKAFPVFEETVTLTDNTQETREYFIPNRGDLQGIILEVDAVSGTFTSNLSAGIQNVSLYDRESDPIFQNINGKALVYLQNMQSNKEVLDNTSQFRSYVVVPVGSERLDARFKLRLGAAADFGTTAGSQLRIRLVAVYAEGVATGKKTKFQRITETLSVGTNTLTPSLPKGVLLHQIALVPSSVSAIDEIRHSADGAEELKLKVQDIYAIYDTVKDFTYPELLELYPSPYEISNKTVLEVDANASGTVDIIIFGQV